ncbi:phage tail tube protein [Serratia sp. 121840015-1]
MGQLETYYYGQGKVFLARRLPNGRPGAYRWIGDVSALALALTVEKLSHKESYSGQRTTARSFPTSKDGTVTSTWHELSAENLALVLYGDRVVIPGGSVTAESLPAGIKAGERFALAHQRISDAVIGELVEGTDYELDYTYGAVTFLKDQTAAPSINYKYAGGVNTTLFTSHPENYALRFEGINLAEGGAAKILELYKLSFDPVSTLALIQGDTSLAGLETTANVLFDNVQPNDPTIGKFGRVIDVAEPVE